MKKVLLVATAVVLGLGSCTKNCVTCTGVTGVPDGKVCKDEYNDSGQSVSWDTWRSTAISLGCKESN